MTDDHTISATDAERAADLVTMILRGFPPLVAAIRDEDAALLRASLDAAASQLRSRDTLLPILVAHGIGGDPAQATKDANIRIVRAVLALRDVVMAARAASAEDADRRALLDANRRHLMRRVGMGE